MSEHPLEPLGNICEINPDTLAETSEPKRRYRYIDISSIKEQRAVLSTTPLPFADLPSRARRKVAFNDVLLGTVRPNLKNFALIDVDEDDLLCSTGFAVLRSKEDISDPQFIFQAINSEVVGRQLNALVTGSNYPAVNASQVAELLIPIPPLPEQKKIAEILSGIDNLTKELINLLKKKKELLRSLSLSLLGIRDKHPSIHYDSMQLLDCLTLSRGVDITKAFMNPGPYPVISSSGISGWHDKFTHDQEGVIVGRKGSIGNVHYAYSAHWVHDTSLGVADYKGNNKRYTYHLLKNLDLAKYGTASGSPSLNRNDIHPITILLPSPYHQEQIAKILDKEELAYGKLQKKIAAFQQLKGAMSSDLLSGRKRVSDARVLEGVGI